MWSWDRARALRELTMLYFVTTDIKSNYMVLRKKLQQHLPSNTLDAYPNDPVYRQIFHFIHYDSPVPTDQDDINIKQITLNALHNALRCWLTECGDGDEAAGLTKIVRDGMMRSEFKRQNLLAPGNSDEAAGESPHTIDPFQLSQMLTAVSKQSFDECSRSASKYFTDKDCCLNNEATNDDRKFFETYRQSLVPGEVVRTFTEITPPNAKTPFCIFKNFYKHPDGEKYSSGIVAASDSVVYCIGSSSNKPGNKPTSLKLMAFPRASTSTIKSGLMITSTVDGNLVAARIAMRPTLAQRPQDSPPAVYTFNDVATIDDDILRRIRNYTTFEVANHIVHTDPETGLETPIFTNKLVELVGEACRDLFTFLDQPFNPADHRYFPFNQALKPFTPAMQEPYVRWARSESTKNS